MPFKKWNHNKRIINFRGYLPNSSHLEIFKKKKLNSLPPSTSSCYQKQGRKKWKEKLNFPNSSSLSGTLLFRGVPFKYILALPRWPSWLEHHPVHTNVAGSIPWSGHIQKAANWCFKSSGENFFLSIFQALQKSTLNF